MINLKFTGIFLFIAASVHVAAAQADNNERANAIVSTAVQVMGGDRYLQVKSQVGRGRYSIVRDNAVVSFQSFVDVIVFPDKERTEFKASGSKTIQTNSGKTGWIYDGDNEVIREQNAQQVANFIRGLRVSLDSLLRGHWKGEAELSYVGKRPATLGKRNDVIKLTYADGFSIEYEFSDDGLPAKAIYKRMSPDNTEITEEDRYAQFIDVDGIKAPFIIDRFTNGAQNSRINYESIDFNKAIPDSIFAKPSNPKDLRKDLKL